LQFDNNAGNRDPLAALFRELIGQITALEPQEINTAQRLRSALGQVMWASGAWVTLAHSDEGRRTLGFANHHLAKHIRDLATNLVEDTSDAGTEINRSALLGQLFAVGLVMNERKARLEEQGMTSEQIGDEQRRLSRRRIDTELIPSTRLSRIVRLMYNFSDAMGTRQIVHNTQRALMQSPPRNFLEVRGLEVFLLRFMRAEFENWVTEFGMVPTPSEAIAYMVSRGHQALIERHQENPDDEDDQIGQNGILDPTCQILDPATGGGHYYIAILRRIYDLSREGGDSPQVARQVVKDAIGHSRQKGRVHAVDIQPMCVTLTHVHLAEFCEEIGIDFDDLEPRIYLGDTLKLQRRYRRYNRNQTPYEDTMFGRKHLVIGNPPWGGFENAEGIELNQTPINDYLRPFRLPFQQIMRDLTGNDPKVANKEISYAFFSRFALGPAIGRGDYIPPVVCFIMPMTMTWSASWVGMRQWILENGKLRLDNIGGSIFPVNRNDGANIFPAPVGTGNAVYTFTRCEENCGVSALDIWETETVIPAVDAVAEGDIIGEDDDGNQILAGPEDVVEAVPEQVVNTVTAEHKLQKLREWGEI